MSAPPLIHGQVIDLLRTLCAQPSPLEQPVELAATADLIAQLLRRLDMVVRVINQQHPLVIGRRNGRSPATLLLYHRFDTPPPGPWSAWSHEPYQLAERDGALYGRGVAEGKGPLAAQIAALAALLADEQELPCGVVIVADGGGLAGSPGLAAALASQPVLIAADACLASVGACDAAGRPLCYSGSKGQLRIRLNAHGPSAPLAPGFAPTLSNPLWRLCWALTGLKSEDEDILITGFYDPVDGPSRAELSALRATRLDEQARLEAWGMRDFLFGMRGMALARAEAALPTCNLSHLQSWPEGDLACLPLRAEATLDFQLVPRQDPATVVALLREHLVERGFGDLLVERLPGGYSPARTAPDHPFVGQVVTAGSEVFGAPLSVVPAGPFSLPLQIFVDSLACPVVSLFGAPPTSAVYGPDEHLALDHLVRHGHLLQALLRSFTA